VNNRPSINAIQNLANRDRKSTWEKLAKRFHIPTWEARVHKQKRRNRP
jgi:hypothetical protein